MLLVVPLGFAVPLGLVMLAVPMVFMAVRMPMPKVAFVTRFSTSERVMPLPMVCPVQKAGNLLKLLQQFVCDGSISSRVLRHGRKPFIRHIVRYLIIKPQLQLVKIVRYLIFQQKMHPVINHQVQGEIPRATAYAVCAAYGRL
jgi:hypothetical protein